MSTRRMGGLGKLSDFGKSAPPQPQPEIESPPQETPIPSPLRQKQIEEKLVSVNIKITRSQQEWLGETARQVRDNNSIPVPPGERVYPQHLIQVAIEMLQSSEVDWEQVRNIEDLKTFLGFKG